MSVEFAFPPALWLLPAGLIFLFISRRSATNLTPTRRKIVTGIRVLLFVLVVCALADPRIFLPGNSRHVIWAVDVSASVGSAAMKVASDLRRECGFTPGEESLILFAKSPVMVQDGKMPAEPDREGGDATNISSALQFSSAVFPEGDGRILVLVSDGVETDGDAFQNLAALKSSGVLVHSVPVNPPDDPELLIQSVQAPREVRINEPFTLRATITSNRETSATVDVFEDGLLAGSRDIDLERGQTQVEILQRSFRAGRVPLEVKVHAGQDTRSDNNSASVGVMVQGTSRVLLVTGNDGSPLVSALEQQGISLEILPPEALPVSSAALLGFEAVVLDDVPASALPEAKMKALSLYVKDFGGGLLMLGGGNSFGPGGYSGTLIEDILPLRSEFQKQKEDPSLAIVPVIDSSGSMTGDKIEMAASAAMAAVDLLTPLDYAGVVAFDGEARWVVDLQSASNRSVIASRLSTLEAGGGTNISAGLELAAEGLRRSPAKIKHLILLSDGVSIPGPYPEIVARMVADKITLSTVGVGGDADTVLLDQLARSGGGRYYQTDSLENVPQIFAKETALASRSALREIPFLAVPARSIPFLHGVDFASAPPLLGYVNTLVNQGADLWLLTESGEPLLATWRVGLGKTAAFTSDASNVWASEWIAWDGFGKFWAQVIREIKRGDDLRQFPLTLEPVPGGYRIAVEAMDLGGRSLPGADASVTVSGRNAMEQNFLLAPVAPGLLESVIRPEGDGPWEFRVTLKNQNQTFATQYASLTDSFPAEFLMTPVNTALLKKLASESGGKFSPSAAEILASRPPIRSSRQELWSWLVIAALLVFLADVGLRRLHR